MKKVTGLGGVFFKCKNPQEQQQWYAKHLGIDSGEYGATFTWIDEHTGKKAHTAWSTFSDKTEYFKPSEKDFMINYRVENLTQLVAELKEQGVQMAGEIQEFEYGKFAWIVDPEGNKIELWEPIDEKL